MDSFELNKIIGALLGVVFVIFSVSLISDAIFHEAVPEKAGYAIEASEDAGAGGGEPAASGVEDIVPLMASADPAKGEAIFKRCAACHTDDKSGANKVGPNLWGVIERPIASHEGFSYFSAIKDFSKGGEEKWTFDHLNHFIAGPKKYIPGTAMGFAGLPKAEDRANVLAYLRTQADTEVALPTPDEAAKSEDGGGDAKADDAKAGNAKPDDAKAGDAKAGADDGKAGADAKPAEDGAKPADGKASDTGSDSGGNAAGDEQAKPADENAPAAESSETQPGTSGSGARAQPDASSGDKPAATAPADAESDGSSDTDSTPRRQDDGPADNQ